METSQADALCGPRKGGPQASTAPKKACLEMIRPLSGAFVKTLWTLTDKVTKSKRAGGLG